MSYFCKEPQKDILDSFGKVVIGDVRDGTLQLSMNIARGETPNAIKLEQYRVLFDLTDEQREAVCDLLSENTTDTIYRFLEMFEEYPDKMKLIIKHDGQEFDMVQISKKMGSEIACYEDEGWIQRFSKIDRFVL